MTQTELDNQRRYLEDLVQNGSTGNQAWAKNELSKLPSSAPSMPNSSAGMYVRQENGSRQFTPYENNSGIYSESYNPNDKNYQVVFNDGTVKNQDFTNGYLTMNQNYTTDKLTPAMRDAIIRAGGNPDDWKAADNYVDSMMGRIGKASANDPNKVLTEQDIVNELTRLGFSVKPSNGGSHTVVGGQAYLTSGADYDRLMNTYSKLGMNDINIYGDKNPQHLIPNPNSPTYDRDFATGGVNSLYNNAYADMLEKQLKQIRANEDDEKRKRYISMMRAKKDLAETSAAQGTANSGISEGSDVQLSNQYGNDIATIGRDFDKLYTDTAMNGALTLEDLRQRELDNQFRQQQYADAQAQQQWENNFAQQQYTDRQNAINAENELNALIRRADTAVNMGVWTPEVQEVYGTDQATFNKYMQAQLQAQAQKGSGRSSGRRVSNNDNIPNEPTPTTFNGATYQDAVNYMNANNIPGAENILTAGEFSRRISTNEDYRKAFTSYEDYLQNAIEAYRSGV